MKICVVTGSSSGIGAALVKEYIGQGYKLIGIDINVNEALAQEWGPTFSQIYCDLSQKADIARVVSELPESIDVFIHSAGINYVKPFQNSDLSQLYRVLDVNFKAPVWLSYELLKAKKLARSSAMIYIASLSHQLSYPGAAVYAASKDGVSSLARSLSVLLKPKGIHVLTVFPGPTRTPHAAQHSPDNSREHKRMPPEQLARLIFQAQQAKRFYLIPGLQNKVFAFLGTYFPMLTEKIMLKTLYKKMLEKEGL